MKLIEALVQELPRRGGWPEGVEEIWQDYDKMMRPLGWFHDELCEDHRRQHYDAHVKINRKQYEAALAASKTEWDGEGLPPVGCRVEVKADDFEGCWLVIDVVYVHNGEVIGIVQSENEYLNDRLEKFSAGYNRAEFRPIRSEAERKRDEAVKEFVRQLIECVDLHAMNNRQESIVREKLYSMLPTLPGVTVIY
nr:MAG TPA: hypothetical protein [Caudoviricetes sp.]